MGLNPRDFDKLAELARGSQSVLEFNLGLTGPEADTPPVEESQRRTFPGGAATAGALISLAALAGPLAAGAGAEAAAPPAASPNVVAPSFADMIAGAQPHIRSFNAPAITYAKLSVSPAQPSTGTPNFGNILREQAPRLARIFTPPPAAKSSGQTAPPEALPPPPSVPEASPFLLNPEDLSKQYTIEQFMAAIASTESSGGNSNAHNKRTGAHGAWQIMGENWPIWSQQVLGPGKHEQNPENQFLVSRSVFLDYFSAFKRLDYVAAAWFAGPGRAEKLAAGDLSILNYDDGPNKNKKDGTTVQKYMELMWSKIGKYDLNTMFPEHQQWLNKHPDEAARSIASLAGVLAPPPPPAPAVPPATNEGSSKAFEPPPASPTPNVPFVTSPSFMQALEAGRQPNSKPFTPAPSIPESPPAVQPVAPPEAPPLAEAEQPVLDSKQEAEPRAGVWLIDNEQVKIVEIAGMLIREEHAPALQAMVDAARLEGVELKSIGNGPGSGNSFRTFATQINVRKKNCGTTDYDIYKKPSGQCSPPSAKPGSSQHEAGRAIDFNDCHKGSGCYEWLDAHAGEYGFVNLQVKDPSDFEPWHWSIGPKAGH